MEFFLYGFASLYFFYMDCSRYMEFLFTHSQKNISHTLITICLLGGMGEENLFIHITEHIWKLSNHSKIMKRKFVCTFMNHIWFVLWLLSLVKWGLYAGVPLFHPYSFNPLSFNPDLFTPVSFNPSIF